MKQKIRCRHNGSWIIGGGTYEWCYECGAFRSLVEAGIAQITVTSPWCYPQGIGAENPWKAWHDSKASYRKRMITLRANRKLARA